MLGLQDDIIPLRIGYPIMYDEISIVKDIYSLALDNEALV